MNIPKAILIGFALVAAAVYFSRDVGPAQAELGGPNFQISSARAAAFLKLNVDTGEVAWCLARPGRGSDPEEQFKKAKIVCSQLQ